MQKHLNKRIKLKRKYSWWDYERHKKKIAAKGLTSREYERAILDLTRKLGL